MKRIVSLILSLCVIMSISVFSVDAVAFSDLANNHWAYQSVMSLVNEGTIKGYGDGTFKPSKTVTRAEFAKMIGKWNQKYSGTYSDISEKHWGYDYIMWSGLESTGSMIYPDAEMKRGDVINLIWKRNGSPKHDAAPSVITNQGTKPDAASWAYTIGLMKGNDGLNLRLDDSLTRAEAATLIVRSRELVSLNATNNFIDVVDEKLLERTYNTLNLLGEEYDTNRVLTHAELAKMAFIFAADGDAVRINSNDQTTKDNKPVQHFEHKYTKEFFVLCQKVWGEDFYSLKNADANATMQDAIGAIMYGFVRRGTSPYDLGKRNNYYSDCTKVSDAIYENMFLTYAKTHGIKLYANNKLGAQEPVTVKKYAALMLQFNDILGLAVGYNNGDKTNAKMSSYLGEYPVNYKDFNKIISGVPVGVYNLKNDGVIAKDSYNSANQCAFVYSTFLDEVTKYVQDNSNYLIKYTFYPALSYRQNKKEVFTAKVSVANKSEGSAISVDELFGDMIKTQTGMTVKHGTDLYVVFETYEPLMGVHLPRKSAYIKAVFTK